MEWQKVKPKIIAPLPKYFVTGTRGNFDVSYYQGDDLVVMVDGFLFELTAQERANDMNKALWEKQQEPLLEHEKTVEEKLEGMTVRAETYRELVGMLAAALETEALLDDNPLSRVHTEKLVKHAYKMIDEGVEEI